MIKKIIPIALATAIFMSVFGIVEGVRISPNKKIIIFRKFSQKSTQY